MKNTILTVTALLLFSFHSKSQTAQDSLQLEKADAYFESGKFKKAEKIYKKFAVGFHSTTILYKAALTNEKITGENYCLYFKNMMSKGYIMVHEDLFFFGCDPKTFEKIPMGK